MNIRSILLPLLMATTLGCYDKEETSATGEDVEESGFANNSSDAEGGYDGGTPEDEDDAEGETDGGEGWGGNNDDNSWDDWNDWDDWDGPPGRRGDDPWGRY